MNTWIWRKPTAERTKSEHLSILQRSGRYLAHIPNPDFEMKRTAVRQNGMCLFQIPEKEWTEDLIIDAVRQHPKGVFPKLPQPSYPVIKFALQQNGILLQFIQLQTEEWKRIAVQQNGNALQFVHGFPSEEIVTLSLQQRGVALRWVPKEYQTEKFQMIAVQNNGMALQFCHTPSELVTHAAINQSPHAIIFVDEPTDKQQIMAVDANPDTFLHLKEPCEEARKIYVLYKMANS